MTARLTWPVGLIVPGTAREVGMLCLSQHTGPSTGRHGITRLVSRTGRVGPNRARASMAVCQAGPSIWPPLLVTTFLLEFMGLTHI